MRRAPAQVVAWALAGWLLIAVGQAVIGPPQPDGAPHQLTMPLQVQAAHDGEHIHLRLRWPTPAVHRFHDVLRYDGEQWEALNAGDAGALGEDRVSVMLDDGSVPAFARYGAYIMIGDGTRFMPDAADAEAVEAHPWLGVEKDLSDVRKHLPETRQAVGWAQVVSPDSLRAQRQAGYFIDLWHWRGDRGGPLGVADDLHVAEHRFGDSGRSAYLTNWDEARAQPHYMFDPQWQGYRALDWDDVAGGRIAFDDGAFLAPERRAAFDADHDWQPGDTLPRRALRDPEGARAAIAARQRAEDGWREVVLSRALDTGHPEDDKALQHGGRYTVAFAVHRDGAGGRHHHVSLPFTLGLGRDADIASVRLAESEAPDWSQPVREITLFYPGQINWPRVMARSHAGREAVAAGQPLRARHDEMKLALYGVEAEAAGLVVPHWWLSLFAGLMLVAATGMGLQHALRRQDAA